MSVTKKKIAGLTKRERERERKSTTEEHARNAELEVMFVIIKPGTK